MPESVTKPATLPAWPLRRFACTASHPSLESLSRRLAGAPARPATAVSTKLLSTVVTALALLTQPATAQAPGAAGAAPPASHAAVVQAREAFGRKDKAQAARLLQLRQAAQGHPLAQWVDYWELNARLADAQPADLAAFFARWGGTYVEDRMRNDWLLELGRRREWAQFRAEVPRFRMNDDRAVTCYTLMLQHQDGQDVRQTARSAWHAERDPSDGCTLMAQSLMDSGAFTKADAWQEARLSVEANRPRAARLAAEMASPGGDAQVAALWEQPLRFLARRHLANSGRAAELDLLAFIRAAAVDPAATAAQLEGPWSGRLPATLTATAWAHVAKESALKLQPEAADHARLAWRLWDRAHKAGVQPPWSEDLLAWHVRAALREGGDKAERWRLVLRAIEAMPDTAMAAATLPGPRWAAGMRPDDREGTWVYWKARALLALNKPGSPAADAARKQARDTLQALAGQQGFYAQLAGADLKQPFALPPPPAPPSEEELNAARQNPGFERALLLINLGLRAEGVREWNYSLRGMTNRQLLAAAQWACDGGVWDRCINTSERTLGEVHVAQRFPLPLREQLLTAAQAAGLDPSVMLGLIRQESRFIADARSHVGASGLMQLMPATARWTAQKVGLAYKAEMINDPAVNLRLGATYLKLLLDDFDGSLALAAAAYNAGPGRPRRWRDGPTLEPAAWAETIPFNETRDYVKKVLSNAVVYNAILGQPLVDLPARLGKAIGPRDAAAPAPDKDLP
jgi:soluble lytic murein transglycosylase